MFFYSNTHKIFRKFSPITTWVLLLVAFVLRIDSVKAQFEEQNPLEAQQSESANIYGGNPYENEEEEATNSADTLKKERVVKPLESYFFSDSIRAQKSFKWNIDPNYNRVKMQQIDTLIDDWRIDYPFYKDGLGDMALGGLGQATQAIDAYERANYHDFKFAQPFDTYIYTKENAPFYNAKSPITRMTYLESGSKNYRETNFEIMHAQNISPSSGFAVEYRSPGTKGLYQRQETKNHNLAVTAYHTGRRYSVHGGYVNNTIETEENGGVVGLWTVRDSVFEMPVGVPTKLGEAAAKNHYRNNSFFVNQAFGVPLERFDEEDFSLADKSAFYIGHSMSYTTWSRVYTDKRAEYVNERAGRDGNGGYISERGEYYENWYFSPTITRDSIRERVFSNRLFIQAQPWGRDAVVSEVDGGFGLDLNAYQQFEMEDYLSGKYNKSTRSSWFVYASAGGNYRKYFDWSGEFKVYPSGYRAGDMMARGDIDLRAYIRNKPIIFTAAFKTELQEAAYWQENLHSNHFIFQESLNKQSDTRLEAKLRIPAINFELGASERIVADMIYYDEAANIAQANDVVSLTSVYLRKRFQIGGLNLDHRLLGQWSSNEVVAPVPQLSAFLSYYYDFFAVKDVLRLQIGVDGRYTTSYYMPGYNPALSTFYNQREAEIGDYPYLDAFVSAKWKRMRILVKYQHLNHKWLGNGEYFQVANYPLNPSMFKIGISWGFYD